MRISEVASFLVRRLLPQQRSRITRPGEERGLVSPPEVHFETAASTLEILYQDYSLLKERIETLEAFQKSLIQSSESHFSWPSLPSLKARDPSVQALWELVELRALILQEQAKLRREQGSSRKKT